MNQFTQRHYQALLGYLKTNLRSGALHDGSRLPPEDRLAEELNFSVPSLREALHLLEVFGLLTSDAGGTYRLSHDFSRGFTDLFSLMLLMNQLKYTEVHRLRRSIELQSVPAIIENITERERQMLYLALARMMASSHGDRRADAEFHDLLLTASGDQLVICLNRALSQFMGTNRNLTDDTFYFENWDELVQIHVKLYRAICARDAERATEAVNEHYDFLLFLDEPTK